MRIPHGRQAFDWVNQPRSHDVKFEVSLHGAEHLHILFTPEFPTLVQLLGPVEQRAMRQHSCGGRNSPGSSDLKIQFVIQRLKYDILQSGTIWQYGIHVCFFRRFCRVALRSTEDCNEFTVGKALETILKRLDKSREKMGRKMV